MNKWIKSGGEPFECKTAYCWIFTDNCEIELADYQVIVRDLYWDSIEYYMPIEDTILIKPDYPEFT